MDNVIQSLQMKNCNKCHLEVLAQDIFKTSFILLSPTVSIPEKGTNVQGNATEADQTYKFASEAFISNK